MRGAKCKLALAPLLLAACAEAAYYPDLTFSGACNGKDFLNGLAFRHMGQTASGAPYYKADGRSEYIYYDPDCSGSGDGTGRWIVDSSVPSTTRSHDLDGDGVCSYHGRFNSKQFSVPPTSAAWSMQCGGATVYEAVFVILAPITTTATSTTRTATSTTQTRTSTTKTSTSTVTTRTATSTTGTSTSTTSRTRTSTTVSSTTVSSTSTSVTTATVTASTVTDTSTSSTGTSTLTTITSSTSTVSSVTATATSTITGTQTGTSTITGTQTGTTVTFTTTTYVLLMRLEGACTYKGFLNGLTFKTQGVAANGAMFFKAMEAEQYLYYDLDCNSGGDGQSRWIIDSDPPNTSKTQDLDDDGACNYHARLDSNETARPPEQGSWHLFCGHGWETQSLILTETPAIKTNGEDNKTEAEGSVEAFLVKGKLCNGSSFLEGTAFVHSGTTASGAPYFKAAAKEEYLYFDPSCSGDNSSRAVARWVIDSDAPNTTKISDLDGDSMCEYHARARSEDTRSPPLEAMWHVRCGEEWQDFWLTLEELPATTTTTITTQPPDMVVNGAGGLVLPRALLLLLPVLAASLR